jgi:hypothetical protein
MADKESLPKQTPGDTLTEAAKIAIHLIEKYPAGDLNDFIRDGYRAFEEGDLVLARAAANFVISRAPPHSGDLLRGIVLSSQVFGRVGDASQEKALLNLALNEEF